MAQDDFQPHWAKVLFDYAAIEQSELTVHAGEIVHVEERNDTGWCLARKENSDASGWLPTDYVEKCDPPSSASGGGAAPAAASVPSAPVILEPEPEPEVLSVSPPAPALVPDPVPVAPAPAPAPAVSAGPSKAEEAKAAAALKALSGGSSGGGGYSSGSGGYSKPAVSSGGGGGDGKTCAACGKAVTSAFVVAKEKTYHAECFKCNNCQTALGGKAFIEKDGLIYCENCYYESFNPKCAYCEEVIKGQYISALGKSWHPDHFVCTECGAPFEGSQFHKHNDKPYCEKHFNELFAESCAKCGQKIEGQVFEALDRKWHLHCFTCVVGDHQIGEGVQFHLHEDRVYCPQHFEELFLQKCAGCGQIIKGQYVKVLDSHFHPQCWKCSDCGVVITSDNCGQAAGKFYCKNCVTKKGGGSSGAKPASAASMAKPAGGAAASGGAGAAKKEVKGAAAAAPPEEKNAPAGTAFYTVESLKLTASLPKGVDAATREMWLGDDDFVKLFGVKKSEWEKLPQWKKNRMKQKVGLY